MEKRAALRLCIFVLIASLWTAPADAKIAKASVEKAWSRIAAAAGMKTIPITYEKDDAPNAWVKFQSSDNFSVHVTQGLMQVLNSPDEIAGVLGHEVGHVKCGHYSKGVQRNVGWSILGTLLGKAGGIAEVAGAVGMNLAESGFSREQEVEADDYGMDLAVKAGYSPWGLYNAMKGFKDNGFKTEPSGFNSHPPTDRRLRHLQERAQKIQKTPR
ncbi:MAG: M48 family metallopeptidase [Synergistaceae bacterium]|jgi:putative metalloprotease|nr:M48 family metallopeptidase [Synergistaceae bacterium]